MPLAAACASALAVTLAGPVMLAEARAEGRAAPPAAPALPSGQTVTGHDMLLERQADGQVWLVLRYLAPRIARGTGDLAYEDVAADLDALCDGPGLAAAAEAAARGTPPDQIVVALMDRPVPRGAPDPDATLFFGAYEAQAEGCAWR